MTITVLYEKHFIYSSAISLDVLTRLERFGLHGSLDFRCHYFDGYYQIEMIETGEIVAAAWDYVSLPSLLAMMS